MQELEPQLDVVDTHSEWEARQAWDDLGKQAFANLRRSMFLEQHPVGIEQVLVKAPGNNQRSGIKQLDSVPEPQEPGVV